MIIISARSLELYILPVEVGHPSYNKGFGSTGTSNESYIEKQIIGVISALVWLVSFLKILFFTPVIVLPILAFSKVALVWESLYIAPSIFTSALMITDVMGSTSSLGINNVLTTAS